MSTDNFIGAVKVKRDEAIDSFNHSTSWLATTLETDAHETLKKAFSDSLDQAVGGILDVVSEQYEEIVEIVDTSVDDELISMLQISADLSTIYFEQVSS